MRTASSGLVRAWWAIGFSMILVGVRPAPRNFATTTPRFEGKVFPEPPAQHQPWTAPATRLPQFLTATTGLLFDQGVADPRGCEYRRVQIATVPVTLARGFVLPERPDVIGRFVIGWDGLLYPVAAVGELLDLDRDITDLVAAVKQIVADGQDDWLLDRGRLWELPPEPGAANSGARIDDSGPIKLCMLLRLGRADLAETLFAAGTGKKPGPGAADPANPQISYATLATNWAEAACGRLIACHVRGEDVLAADLARKLVRFRDRAVPRLGELGLQQHTAPRGIDVGPPVRFFFLGQLDALLRDEERRVALPPRGPIPPPGGDPTGRIAALIRDLDQINEPQHMSPGMAHPGSSVLVADLVAEGDPAVAPLLAVLEADDRLTRSVTDGRGSSAEGFVHPVVEVAFEALTRILRTSEFEAHRSTTLAERRDLAASIRRFWERNRGVSLPERWYGTLLDDSAGAIRWVEAAEAVGGHPVDPRQPFLRPTSGPMQGAPLRVGRDPSVSALIIRRARQVNPPRSDPPVADLSGFSTACKLTAALYGWEPSAALPLLRELSRECLVRSTRQYERTEFTTNHQYLTARLAEFTANRVQLGDAGALDEYAGWLRTVTPPMVEFGTFTALRPLIDHPNHPGIAASARWLFTDPRSPWVPLHANPLGQQVLHFPNLFASPLIAVAGFREGVIHALANRTAAGTITTESVGRVTIRADGQPALFTAGASNDLAGVPANVEHPFRGCDEVAFKLMKLEGSPRINLFWPEARRDEAVAASVSFLKRYGPSFSTQAPSGVLDYPNPAAHLRFPILDRPATLDDVASTRAIFTLAGLGETRRMALAGFPRSARWLTLRDNPIEVSGENGKTWTEYETTGLVWQAEEVQQGGLWTRYYGFVGPNVIARVPAAELEFREPNGYPYGPPRPIESTCATVEPPPARYKPGQPVVITVQLRNNAGLPHSIPTDFVRLSADGKPALRQGVTLQAWMTTERGGTSPFNQPQPNIEVKPTRRAHFRPGNGSRELATLESVEVARLTLNDWFDLTKPARYRVGLRFAADSGIGEAWAYEVYFEVVGGSD